MRVAAQHSTHTASAINTAVLTIFLLLFFRKSKAKARTKSKVLLHTVFSILFYRISSLVRSNFACTGLEVLFPATLSPSSFPSEYVTFRRNIVMALLCQCNIWDQETATQDTKPFQFSSYFHVVARILHNTIDVHRLFHSQVTTE
jgi:hypothetical protein